MTDLAEMIIEELTRQFKAGGLTALSVTRYPSHPSIETDVYLEGRLDVQAFAVRVKAALFDADMARIEESIAKGARRSKGNFKP